MSHWHLFAGFSPPAPEGAGERRVGQRVPAVAGVRDGVEVVGRSCSRSFEHGVRMERSCRLEVLGTPKNARSHDD